MIAIVGLGNPGKSYEKNVHNLGFMAVDYFAQENSLKFTKKKYSGSVSEGVIDGEKIILLKPDTFMNLSGKSVEELVHSLKLDISHLIVIYDDIDLNVGDIRIRAKGSAGTHNGMRDIVQRIGENFPRIRIGAGRPEYGDLANFVLSNIPAAKMVVYNSLFDGISKMLSTFIKNKTVEGIDTKKYNEKVSV